MTYNTQAMAIFNIRSLFDDFGDESASYFFHLTKRCHNILHIMPKDIESILYLKHLIQADGSISPEVRSVVLAYEPRLYEQLAETHIDADFSMASRQNPCR